MSFLPIEVLFIQRKKFPLIYQKNHSFSTFRGTQLIQAQYPAAAQLLISCIFIKKKGEVKNRTNSASSEIMLSGYSEKAFAYIPMEQAFIPLFSCQSGSWPASARQVRQVHWDGVPAYVSFPLP